MSKDSTTSVKVPKSAGSSSRIYIKIHTPSKTYYNGFADSISIVGEAGSFDILPKHKDLIRLLGPCDIIVRNTQSDERISISNGVMYAKAGRVIVLSGS